MTAPRDPRFVPALGFHALTGFYDGLIGRLFAERDWKGRLVEAVAPAAGEVIADLGAGTGTLALMLRRACPGVRVLALEPDPAMRDKGHAKAAAAGLDLEWLNAGADAIPLADGGVDAVVSSLVFHHLDRTTKQAALREAHRVLRPGGRLCLADWAAPDDQRMRLAFLAVQLLDGFATTEDNRRGLLPALVQAAGFVDLRETYRRRTWLGNLAFLQATKPPGRSSNDTGELVRTRDELARAGQA